MRRVWYRSQVQPPAGSADRPVAGRALRAGELGAEPGRAVGGHDIWSSTGLLFAGPRVSLLAPGLDVAPLGVAAAHRFSVSSSASSARCWATLFSASAMASPALPPSAS